MREKTEYGNGLSLRTGPVRSEAIHRTVGRNIRTERAQAGMTATAMAKSAGVTNVFVSEVEHGKSGVSLELLVRIARTLGVKAERLVSGL